MEYIKTKNSVKTSSALYLITVLYFITGFINITLAVLALLCMALPFILVYKNRKQTWCRGACPRADLLSRMGKRFGANNKAPRWLLGAKAKKGVLTYFCMNLMFATASTFAVSEGMMDPIDKVRFLIVFEFPWSLPQMVQFAGISDTLLHFSYRLYSIMFTSTVIGVTLSLFFKPKSWCAICPVNTMTAGVLKNLEA
jgi:4Fe-4S binding domain